jgi:glutamate-1-semialdehyde 2,1-aminomutase
MSAVGNTQQSLHTAVLEARARYADRRPTTRQIHLEAEAVMPGGNTRTVLHFRPFPLRIVRGDGAMLYDADGHVYVDLLGEYTAGLFGHSEPRIVDELHRALDDGLSLGAPNPHEVRFARLVTERFPAMEKVRFTNSGTEANLMAVATARFATRRNRVLVFGGAYHGGVLSFAHTNSPTNVPFEYVLGTYNDTETTRVLIREVGPTLACVLVEPMLGSGGCIPGDLGFLRMLRAETRDCGASLVFDEVMTSRFGSAGAGSIVGVKPDLMTLGKWVGGGMSFGAFGGCVELMDLYHPNRRDGLAHAGTFNNNALTMRAGVVTLSEVFTPTIAQVHHARGDVFRNKLNDVFASAAVGLHASGAGSLLNIHGCTGPINRVADIAASSDARKELLFLDLLESGFYMARRGFIALSLAIDDQMLQRFLDVVQQSVQQRAPLLRD